ncbi:hypothetical protein BpHYR1_027959 [Brachionus plicatilis]|uniref:Uncharacterized protein n=1 Tax=Brachionus plicatilis TaxID=10195 RepID=A0A3M7RVA9_BRAPC|nr:hypothetical protein BpHYR1_027959 [Brachionus plicatilis]
MISENDSRQAYDLNNAAAVPQQSSQQSQKPAQNPQAASSQASSSQTNPAASISSQFFNLQNFASQQMDINQYLENQMSQLTQIIYILKQMQVNQIEPLKTSNSQHQAIIDQLQSHQSQFQQFVKQQSQINQQHSLKLQQQEQQLGQLQSLVQQLQSQASIQQQSISAPQAQPQYIPQAQAQPQVAQIQQQPAPQAIQNAPQQVQQQQQQPPAPISAPPTQPATSSHQNLQPAPTQSHYAHLDPHLNFSMSQNPLQYLNQAQLMSLLSNHVQLNTKHIPVHPSNQLVNNLVYSGPAHDDGEGLHVNYGNFSQLNAQSIEALGQLIQQRLSLGQSQSQSRPIPSSSPNQQDGMHNGNLGEQTLQQQIENVLTGSQPVQPRPISLASSVLAPNGQSNANGQAQTANSQACSQIMTHSNNTPRILNLQSQIVSDQVLMSNANAANMATGASMQNQNQQQTSMATNNQNQ